MKMNKQFLTIIMGISQKYTEIRTTLPLRGSLDDFSFVCLLRGRFCSGCRGRARRPSSILIALSPKDGVTFQIIVVRLFPKAQALVEDEHSDETEQKLGTCRFHQKRHERVAHHPEADEHGRARRHLGRLSIVHPQEKDERRTEHAPAVERVGGDQQVEAEKHQIEVYDLRAQDLDECPGAAAREVNQVDRPARPQRLAGPLRQNV